MTCNLIDDSIKGRWGGTVPYKQLTVTETSRRGARTMKSLITRLIRLS